MKALFLTSLLLHTAMGVVGEASPSLADSFVSHASLASSSHHSKANHGDGGVNGNKSNHGHSVDASAASTSSSLTSKFINALLHHNHQEETVLSRGVPGGVWKEGRLNADVGVDAAESVVDDGSGNESSSNNNVNPSNYDNIKFHKDHLPNDDDVDLKEYDTSSGSMDDDGIIEVHHVELRNKSSKSGKASMQDDDDLDDDDDDDDDTDDDHEDDDTDDTAKHQSSKSSKAYNEEKQNKKAEMKHKKKQQQQQQQQQASSKSSKSLETYAPTMMDDLLWVLEYWIWQICIYIEPYPLDVLYSNPCASMTDQLSIVFTQSSLNHTTHYSTLLSSLSSSNPTNISIYILHNQFHLSPNISSSQIHQNQGF